MNVCRPGSVVTALAAFFLLGFFLPVTLLFFYLSLFAPSLTAALRLTFLAGGLLFGALLGLAAYRAFCAGLPCITYDQESIVFHFSRKERQSFSYGALAGALAGIEPVPLGYVLYLRQGQRTRPFPLYWTFSHYRDLSEVLRKKGVFQRFSL